MKHCIARIIRQAGLTPHPERTLVELGATPQCTGDRLDVDFVGADGNVTGIDVTCIHPTAPSYVHSSASRNGAALHLAEVRKMTKYAKAKTDAGHHYLPAAVETYGRWSGRVARFLHGLAKYCTETAIANHEFLQTRLVDKWWKLLSCNLQTHNAILLISRAAAADRAAARRTEEEVCLTDLYVRDCV